MPNWTVDLHDLSYKVYRAALHAMNVVHKQGNKSDFWYTLASFCRIGHKALKFNNCYGNFFLLAHAQNDKGIEMLILYLQVPLLQAGRLTRYARSICSCPMSSGFTVSTQRQAAFSSCKRGAIILRCNVNHTFRHTSRKKQKHNGLTFAKLFPRMLT